MAKAERTVRFGVDKGQYGTIVAGRRFEVELTQADVKAIHKTVDAFRAKTGLPLVFVSPGASETDNDDMASETFYAGLLVAAASDGDKPVRVDKSLLDPARIGTIPSDFWETLEEKHELAIEEQDEEDDEGDEESVDEEDAEDEDEVEDEDEDEDEEDEDEEDEDDESDADAVDEAADDEEEDEGPPEGIFLVPGGWAVASIFLGSTEEECLATTSSEDTFIGKHLSDDLLKEIRAAKEPLLLVGEYC
jgi:hypothetical protein